MQRHLFLRKRRRLRKLKPLEEKITKGHIRRIAKGTIVFLVFDQDTIVKKEKNRTRSTKSEVVRLVCDNKQIHKRTNWKPKISNSFVIS